jgi:hypothetical protein
VTKPKPKPWYVDIVETATGQVIKTMGPLTERDAERVDRGVSINLNHEKFHTNIRQ